MGLLCRRGLDPHERTHFWVRTTKDVRRIFLGERQASEQSGCDSKRLGGKHCKQVRGHAQPSNRPQRRCTHFFVDGERLAADEL
jgi:hypothetical protein